MMTKIEPPLKPICKDTSNNTQLKRVYEAFFHSPKTMKEVDIEIGVMRENICWLCRELRMQNYLFAVCIRRCKVTKRNVIAWSTNSEFKPIDKQLKLFGNG